MSDKSEFEFRISRLIQFPTHPAIPPKIQVKKEAKSVKVFPVRNEHYYCANCGANTATVKKRLMTSSLNKSYIYESF